MKIYESKHLTINYYENEKTIENVWLDTFHLLEDNYLSDFQEIKKCIGKYVFDKFISDSQDLEFGIVPEMQNWSITEIITPFLLSGVQKIALVIDKEFFEMRSEKEKVSAPKFGIRYFDDLAAAKSWLNE